MSRTRFRVNPHSIVVENTSQFSQDLTRSSDEDEGYFLVADIQYPEKLHGFPNDLTFLAEKMKVEKAKKLVANLYDKQEYVIHIKN